MKKIILIIAMLIIVLRPKLLLWFFILVGICIVIIHFLEKRKKYELISGVVVEIKKKTINEKTINGSRREATYYVPIFEYTFKGKVYKVEHCINTNIQGKSLFVIGERIELQVYIESPEKARLNSHLTKNALLYGGLMFIIIPMIIICALSWKGIY